MISMLVRNVIGSAGNQFALCMARSTSSLPPTSPTLIASGNAGTGVRHHRQGCQSGFMLVMGPQSGKHDISQHEIGGCRRRENEEPSSSDWVQFYHLALTGFRSLEQLTVERSRSFSLTLRHAGELYSVFWQGMPTPHRASSLPLARPPKFWRHPNFRRLRWLW